MLENKQTHQVPLQMQDHRTIKQTILPRETNLQCRDKSLGRSTTSVAILETKHTTRAITQTQGIKIIRTTTFGGASLPWADQILGHITAIATLEIKHTDLAIIQIRDLSIIRRATTSSLRWGEEISVDLEACRVQEEEICMMMMMIIAMEEADTVVVGDEKEEEEEGAVD